MNNRDYKEIQYQKFIAINYNRTIVQKKGSSPIASIAIAKRGFITSSRRTDIDIVVTLYIREEVIIIDIQFKLDKAQLVVLGNIIILQKIIL